MLRDSSIEAESPALLLGLHGYGMDARQMGTLVDVYPVASHIYVAVDGFEQFSEGGHSWFDIVQDDTGVSIPEGAVESAVDRLAELIPELVTAYGADPGRVFVIGYSQGGTLALAAAYLRPDLATGFVGFAGSVPDLITKKSATAERILRNVLIGYGTLDPLVSREDVERTVRLLESTGHLVEVHSSRVPHVVGAEGRAAITHWLNLHL